jgi:hypothetical protein
MELLSINHSYFVWNISKLYDQVSKDDAGTIRIQQPQSGPFYVSPNTIDDLIIANHGDLARLL